MKLKKITVAGIAALTIVGTTGALVAGADTLKELFVPDWQATGTEQVGEIPEDQAFGSGESFQGEMPELPEGELPDGEMPEFMNGESQPGESSGGEMPELPEGEIPEFADGELPELPPQFNMDRNGQQPWMQNNGLFNGMPMFMNGQPVQGYEMAPFMNNEVLEFPEGEMPEFTEGESMSGESFGGEMPEFTEGESMSGESFGGEMPEFNSIPA